MKKIFISAMFLLGFQVHLLAQDSRQVGNNDQKAVAIISYKTKLKQQEQRQVAFNNHPYNRYYDRLIVEYEERMKANVKKYKVMARKMQKPQYSDPSYFGHKRKPKKRPVGKRKYCKECEIVH